MQHKVVSGIRTFGLCCSTAHSPVEQREPLLDELRCFVDLSASAHDFPDSHVSFVIAGIDLQDVPQLWRAPRRVVAMPRAPARACNGTQRYRDARPRREAHSRRRPEAPVDAAQSSRSDAKARDEGRRPPVCGREAALQNRSCRHENPRGLFVAVPRQVWCSSRGRLAANGAVRGIRAPEFIPHALMRAL